MTRGPEAMGSGPGCQIGGSLSLVYQVPNPSYASPQSLRFVAYFFSGCLMRHPRDIGSVALRKGVVWISRDNETCKMTRASSSEAQAAKTCKNG